ncbi:MAG: helix-turn-helix domain-containing protein [Desulfobacteraceae bacterium]|jgi:transcriptional regulator of acetoin/glycerol metabolism
MWESCALTKLWPKRYWPSSSCKIHPKSHNCVHSGPAWPGNVRELQNAVQFAIVKSNNQTIVPDDLPLELCQVRENALRRGPARKLDARSVQEALIKTGGNKARAARELGVGRATLYRFLSEKPDIVAKL